MKFIEKDNRIVYLETGEIIFNLNEIPKTIRLNKCSFISDVKRFIISHINSVNTYGFNKVGLAYFDRLIELENLINEQQRSRADL